MSLAGRKIVVFDLEIKNEINKNGVTWKSYDRMGISVGVSFCFSTMEYRVFMDDNLDELANQLNEAELVVGFNILGFDLPLLRATKECTVGLRPELPVYDLLDHSRAAKKLQRGQDYENYPKGMKLDNHLVGTFGASAVKTENGAHAPIFYQQGKLGRLISYCLADVQREARLFKHVWQSGTFTTDTHGTFSAVTKPQEAIKV